MTITAGKKRKRNRIKNKCCTRDRIVLEHIASVHVDLSDTEVDGERIYVRN